MLYQGSVRVVSCYIRAVLGWYQGGIVLSGWYKGGIRVVSGWC